MNRSFSLDAFKAYDLRGRVPEEMHAELARDLGLALAAEFSVSRAIIGRDARFSGPELSAALAEGLRLGGADVADLGLCCTEEVYHATAEGGYGLGVMVTASHNPPEWNGMKMVLGGAAPLSGDTGLLRVRERVAAGRLPLASRKGGACREDFRERYLAHILSLVDVSQLRPLRIVADAGYGCAALLLEKLAERLPFAIIPLRNRPDGSFPDGVPNPLLPENRAFTARAVLEHKADMGLAWDGDADRCFFYDANGRFIEGYYLVGLLAQVMLARYPGAAILHDPRLTWNTRELILESGGIPVECKTGHAFLKERMRTAKAAYGGEMSAHHYFRDFACCDSGMLPWLLVAEHLCRTGESLAQLVDARMERYPCSGEINRRVSDAPAAIEAVRAALAPLGGQESHVDGLSLEFAAWRLNLRASNTEALLRLNVESRGDADLLREKTAMALELLRPFAVA